MDNNLHYVCFFYENNTHLFLLIGTLFADEHILEQENFDAWQFTCVGEQKQKICELRELVFDPNTEEVVSYFQLL